MIEGLRASVDRATIESLTGLLDLERQRANGLADTCGVLQSVNAEQERTVAFLDNKAKDLESQHRSDERTIRTLRDQIIKLGARPL